MKKIYVFHFGAIEDIKFHKAVQYWSDTFGNPVDPKTSKQLKAADLPAPLLRAQNELFFDGDFSSRCNLVETERGYGIALSNVYDEGFADECCLSMEDLFDTAVRDASIIANDPAFDSAEIFLRGQPSPSGDHVLAVVFPADTPRESFRHAAARMESLVYKSAREFSRGSSQSKVEQAYDLLNTILSVPNGNELFELSKILFALREHTDTLSKSDLLILAQKTMDCCFTSSVPFLAAERADAVGVCLSFGLSDLRVPDLPQASAEEITKLLLSCDMDVFTEIVDCVALANQSYYAPDNDYLEAQLIHKKAVRAIQAITSEKASLNSTITDAQLRYAQQDPVTDEAPSFNER